MVVSATLPERGLMPWAGLSQGVSQPAIQPARGQGFKPRTLHPLHGVTVMSGSTIPVTLAESYTWRAGTDEIRACLFCTHSNRVIDPKARLCRHPQVTGHNSGRIVHCTTARDIHGPCGIDARFLRLSGE